MTDEQIAALRKASAVLCGTGYHDEASAINTLLAASTASDKQEAATLSPFEDERVQIVYDLICDTETVQPKGEHWDGFVSRRIVGALDVHAKLCALDKSASDKQVAKLCFLLRTNLARLDDETLTQLDAVEHSLEQRRPANPSDKQEAVKCETCGAVGTVASTNARCILCGMRNAASVATESQVRGRMRLKVEKLAALLTQTEETKQDIVKWDGEVTGVRIGWGAWALLRAAIIDVIEYKCESDSALANAAPLDKSASDAPKLDKPAQVSGTRFGKGVKWSTVIGAAQRYYEFMQTPEKEALRIASARSFMERIHAAPRPADKADQKLCSKCNCWVHPSDDCLVADCPRPPAQDDVRDAAKWRAYQASIKQPGDAQSKDTK